MKKKILYIILALMLSLVLGGCSLISGEKIPENGIYRCNELRLTIDFNDNCEPGKSAYIETETGEIEYYSMNTAFSGYGLLDIQKIISVSIRYGDDGWPNGETLTKGEPYILGWDVLNDRKHDCFIWRIRGETEARSDLKEGRLFLFYRVE